MNKREDDLIDVSLLADNAKSERIPVRDIKVGTKINGEIVDTILSSGENFAMFHFQGDRHFAYQLEGLRNIETDQAIARIGRARAKASSKLKGTVDRELDSLLKSTLRGLFQGNKPELFEDAMCQIEACVDALNEVEVTIGNSKNFIVWIDHQGELKYTASRNVADFEYSISEYTRIKSLAIALLPQELMKSFYRRLGATLTTAFRLKPEQDEIRALFKPLEQYIQLTISNNLRIKYLVTTCSSAIFLTLLTYLAHEMLIIPQFLHTSLIVIAGGFLGTFISVFERSKTLTINDNESIKLIILQGLLRVLLGGIFGLIAYSAAVSGLAFSIFKESVSSLILLGVAAGFSERLIPDLIQGFSSKNNGIKDEAGSYQA